MCIFIFILYDYTLLIFIASFLHILLLDAHPIISYYYYNLNNAVSNTKTNFSFNLKKIVIDERETSKDASILYFILYKKCKYLIKS